MHLLLLEVSIGDNLLVCTRLTLTSPSSSTLPQAVRVLLVSYAMRSYAAGLPCFDLRLQRAGPRKKAQSVTHGDALPANERH